MSFSTKIILGSLLVVLISIWAAIVRAPDRNLHLTALDVGQGDAMLIQTPNRQNVLIDGGPDNTVVEKISNQLPFYDRKLSAVILSHPHADHLFGLIEVLKRYQVEKVYLTGVVHTSNEYLTFLNIIKEKNIPSQNLKLGDQLDFGEVELKTLWPVNDLSGQSSDNLNNSSLVLELTYRKFNALLLGDLEQDDQEAMIKEVGIGNVDVIKISHHGSSNGLNMSLLNRTQPKLTIISVGADNKYGHPAFSTVTELTSRDITVKRTDRDGDVKVSSDGETFW